METGDSYTLGGEIERAGKGLEAAGKGAAAFGDVLNRASGGWWKVHKAKQQARAAKELMTIGIEAMEDLEIELSETDRRGIAFTVLQNIKDFENLESVVARMSIPDDAPASEIEEEWMSDWLDYSKKAFSEWNQEMWANIGTTQAVDPNSVSRIALSIISKMGKNDMQSFKDLCAISYYDAQDNIVDPLIFDLDDEHLEMVLLSEKTLRRFEEIGLIRILENEERLKKLDFLQSREKYQIVHIGDDTGSGRVRFGLKGQDVEVHYITGFEQQPFYTHHPLLIDFGIVRFTESGRELAGTISYEIQVNAQFYIQQSYARIQQEIKEAELSKVFKRFNRSSS